MSFIIITTVYKYSLVTATFNGQRSACSYVFVHSFDSKTWQVEIRCHISDFGVVKYVFKVIFCLFYRTIA